MKKTGHEERRRHPRADVSLKIAFKSPDDFAESFLGNISCGGLLIKISAPLKVNEEFSLRFSVEGIDRTFSAKCRVIWVQELYDRKADKMAPVIGCKFVDLDPKDLSLIENYVISCCSR
jgi:uncharacterized protein (TIGR02266 family)